jgi:hypothetical protein
MPYPVLPPQPPAIIQSLPHEQLSPAAVDSNPISISPSAKNLANIQPTSPVSSTTVDDTGARSPASPVNQKDEIEPQSYNAVDLGSSIGIGLSTTQLTPSAIATQSLTQGLDAIAQSSFSSVSLEAPFASVSLDLAATLSPEEFSSATTEALHPLIQSQAQQETTRCFRANLEPVATTD